MYHDWREKVTEQLGDNIKVPWLEGEGDRTVGRHHQCTMTGGRR